MKANGLTRETILRRDLPERSFPQFSPGDTIIVNLRIKEEAEKEKEAKERIQAFQGDVIAMRENGISSTFTVRKIGAHGVAIERIFPFYSTTIASVAVVRRGRVRRAKLFYVRNRIGKAAQIQEIRSEGRQTTEASTVGPVASAITPEEKSVVRNTKQSTATL
jgi:large subunit ribosomal protein L19